MYQQSLTLNQICIQIVDDLLEHPLFSVFRDPIDPIADEIPDYPKIVKNPQDLSTIRSRLVSGQYMRIEDFNRDMLLCFTNCILFNQRDTTYGEIAVYAMELYKKKVRNLLVPTPLEYATRINKYSRKLHDILKSAPPSVYRPMQNILNKTTSTTPEKFDLGELSAALSTMKNKTDIFNISQILSNFDIKFDSKDSAFLSLSNLPQRAIEMLQKYAIERGFYELD